MAIEFFRRWPEGPERHKMGEFGRSPPLYVASITAGGYFLVISERNIEKNNMLDKNITRSGRNPLHHSEVELRIQ